MRTRANGDGSWAGVEAVSTGCVAIPRSQHRFALQRNSEILRDFDLIKIVGKSEIVLEPVGVEGIFTPWNSSAGSIAIKVAGKRRARLARKITVTN